MNSPKKMITAVVVGSIAAISLNGGAIHAQELDEFAVVIGYDDHRRFAAPIVFKQACGGGGVGFGDPQAKVSVHECPHRSN